MRRWSRQATPASSWPTTTSSMRRVVLSDDHGLHAPRVASGDAGVVLSDIHSIHNCCIFINAFALTNFFLLFFEELRLNS
jgi:hypothetical protein